MACATDASVVRGRTNSGISGFQQFSALWQHQLVLVTVFTGYLNDVTLALPVITH